MIDAVLRACAPRASSPGTAADFTQPDDSIRSTPVSEVKISAEPRTEFGKGGARRTRRAGKVPAVLYGHGEKPRSTSRCPPASSPPRSATAASTRSSPSTIADGTQTLALPKAIQRDPIKDTFEHVDLLIVRRGEKVTVDVPVHAHRRGGPRHAGGDRARHAVRSSPRRCTCPTTSRSRSRAWRPARRSPPPTSSCRRAPSWPPTRSWSIAVVSRGADRRAARGRGAARRRPRPRPRPRPPRPAEAAAAEA